VKKILGNQYIFTGHALAGGMGYRLIDTGASNEARLAEAIDNGLRSVAEDDALSVHVITKVWYTHLGYERTTGSSACYSI